MGTVETIIMEGVFFFALFACIREFVGLLKDMREEDDHDD